VSVACRRYDRCPGNGLFRAIHRIFEQSKIDYSNSLDLSVMIDVKHQSNRMVTTQIATKQ
jgi:hypothetical protein